MPVRWEDPAWLAGAHAWIREQCARLGLVVSGEITQPHVRPWSTVLRVATSGGALYFKAVVPALVHEAALTAALARWCPDAVLPVLACDARRGWLLLPDGGTRFRSLPDEERERRWLYVLPRYAELQIEVARHGAEILALGVPDRRPKRMPAVFGSFFESARYVGTGTPHALTPEELARLRALRPRIGELCDALAAGPIPASVQHDDLHDGNVLVGDGGLAVFDWGDASLAHPFFSLRVALQRRDPVLGAGVDEAMVARARDAYLEPWTRFAPRARLLEIARMAQVVSVVARVLAWDLALREVEDLGERAQAFPSLLRELLETAATS